MKIYLVGGTGNRLNILKQKNCRPLFAYPVIKTNYSITDGFGEYFLDSGAYTAFTQNTSLDLGEYIDFIKLHDVKTYAGLDVIGNAEATRKNCDEMLKRGLTDTIPTFHAKENIKHLEYYCEKYDKVAIGGVAQLQGDRATLTTFLDRCFTVIKKHFPIKVHGFAITQSEMLKRYPFYSVDSTSWLSGAKFARPVSFDRTNVSHLPSIGNMAKKRNLFGVSAQFILDKGNHRVENGIDTFIEMEKFITSLWESRGIVWSH